jgi:DNA-binding CsgD family transcriptional regulator
MSGAAARTATVRILRVAIVSNDPLRQAGLASLIAAAGHQPVADRMSADVVLVDDSEQLEGGDAKSVRLGGADWGAAGQLGRDADAIQIDAALRAVAAGLFVRVAEEGFAAMPEPRRQMLLSPREVDVLSAIADGLANKAIARKLGISQHTVKFHVESLFRKLDVRSRAEAVARAIDTLRAARIDI